MSDTPRLPSNPSASVRRRNAHLYWPTPPPLLTAVALHKLHSDPALGLATPGKRIRQDTKPLMNKLEAEWFGRLEAKYPKVKFRPQDRRYKLSNGCWYKPDITCTLDGRETAFEVKGPHAFRGGFEFLKMAAAAWPEVTWILCWKQAGEWRTQTVLP